MAGTVSGFYRAAWLSMLVWTVVATGATGASELTDTFPQCLAEPWRLEMLVQDLPGQVNQPNAVGRTPLSLALDYPAGETVPILLKHGADPNMREPSGDPCGYRLFGAEASYGNDENAANVLQQMLDHGLNPNVTDSQGRTLLHRAVQSNNLRAVLKLINLGLDPSQHDSSGSKAWMYARDWAVAQAVVPSKASLTDADLQWALTHQSQCLDIVVYQRLSVYSTPTIWIIWAVALVAGWGWASRRRHQLIRSRMAHLRVRPAGISSGSDEDAADAVPQDWEAAVPPSAAVRHRKRDRSRGYEAELNELQPFLVLPAISAGLLIVFGLYDPLFRSSGLPGIVGVVGLGLGMFSLAVLVVVTGSDQWRRLWWVGFGLGAAQVGWTLYWSQWYLLVGAFGGLGLLALHLIANCGAMGLWTRVMVLARQSSKAQADTARRLAG